jgi:hypothetical protein
MYIEYMVHSTLADPNPSLTLTLTLTLTLNITLTLTLTLSPTLTLNNINEWENALKTHKAKNNNFKKPIKKNMQDYYLSYD